MAPPLEELDIRVMTVCVTLCILLQSYELCALPNVAKAHLKFKYIQKQTGLVKLHYSD
jgi:hypothetical protein